MIIIVISSQNDNAFGLNTPDGLRIDLLPFGAIAEEGEIIIQGKGMTRIRLDGFEEAYLNGSFIVESEELQFKACSIPGIVILKLIAYDDRPDRRIKDIKDLRDILRHYPDIESNLIWAEYSDLYDSERSHNDVGMKVLGREMRKIMLNNDKLLRRIINILEVAIQNKSNIINLMISDPLEETREDIILLLEYIKHGLTENPT